MRIATFSEAEVAEVIAMDIMRTKSKSSERRNSLLQNDSFEVLPKRIFPRAFRHRHDLSFLLADLAIAPHED